VSSLRLALCLEQKVTELVAASVHAIHYLLYYCNGVHLLLLPAILFSAYSRLTPSTLMIFCNVTLATFREPVALSLDQAGPATPYPTSDRTELPIRIQDNDTHLDDPRDNHPPLAQPNSPRQECPTDPPIACSMTDCAGSPYPPDPYRCKSRLQK
jgi:hypothetical protein